MAKYQKQKRGKKQQFCSFTLFFFTYTITYQGTKGTGSMADYSDS